MQSLLQELPEFLGYYNLYFLIEAALTTVALSAIGCIFGALAGFTIAILRHTCTWVLLLPRIFAVIFTEFFRRVPFLVTLMLCFFSFQLAGIDLSLFAVAAVSVALIASAFLAEIMRAGLESVHRNQWDAAASMNFGLIGTIVHIILPQAWKVILPPAFGFFVLFIKDTALASQIGVIELTYAGKVLNNKGFSAALVFGTVLFLYFAISYPLSRLGAYLERRLALSRHR